MTITSRAATAHAALAALPLPRPVTTRYGAVVIGAVALEGGGRCLAVWINASSGDPHYRIFNPPLLVKDPAGTPAADGQRYRVDPVTAVAEVIAQHRAGRGGRR
jgi:hypothetical protein